MCWCYVKRCFDALGLGTWKQISLSHVVAWKETPDITNVMFAPCWVTLWGSNSNCKLFLTLTKAVKFIRLMLSAEDQRLAAELGSA